MSKVTHETLEERKGEGEAMDGETTEKKSKR